MTDLAQAEQDVIEANQQEINQRYAGDMGEIIVKEMAQNSIDASREIYGAHTQFEIFPPERRIQAIDQGTAKTAILGRPARSRCGRSHGSTNREREPSQVPPAPPSFATPPCADQLIARQRLAGGSPNRVHQRDRAGAARRHSVAHPDDGTAPGDPPTVRARLRHRPSGKLEISPL